MTKKIGKNASLSWICIGLVVIAAGAGAQAGTAAYWRFEEGPLNAFPDHGGLGNGQFYPGALDSSGNGYDLSIWQAEDWCGERYRDEVPAGTVSLTGVVNNFSLQRTGEHPGMWTDHPDFDNWSPLTWTVEAWCRATSVNRWQSIVGRDGDDLNATHGNAPAFSLMFTDGNAVLSRFIDMSGTYHEVRTDSGFVTADRWYHLAVTSDGTDFILYVDGVEAARAPLETTDARMSNGSGGNPGGADWHPGAWTVFRGMWEGSHRDRWFGYIDEVRVSDTALTPDEFLNSGAVLDGPGDWAVYPDEPATAVFIVTSTKMPFGETMTSVDWYIDVPGPDTRIAADGVKYDIAATPDASTLTIYNVTAADALDYYAVATYSDGSTATSARAGRLYVRSGLVHRWSFDGDMTDAVGAADGAVVDPAGVASFADGQLRLNNPAVTAGPDTISQVAYVDLPAGLVSALENYMTIEMWLTPHRNANWTTFFAFGDTVNADPFADGFNGGRIGLLGQLNRNTDGQRGPSFTSIVPGGVQKHLTAATPLTLDEEFMYAVVWDGNTNEMKHYVNGVLVDIDSLNIRLSDTEDVKCWLGLPFWGDPVLNASLNELRIYDAALTGEAVAAHYAVGPNALKDVAGVVVTPSGLTLHEEGAAAGELHISLEFEPADTVILTIEEQAGRGQVTLDRDTLVFTPDTWSDPQAVRVMAVDDAVLENAEHLVALNFTADSADANYYTLRIDPVLVTVLDNECGAAGYALADFTLDCVIDISDLARFAEDWLACSRPDEVGCVDYRGR